MLNSTHLSTPSPKESHLSTSRQSRKRSGWSTSIACRKMQRLRQNGRPLPPLSPGLRPRKDFVLFLNGAFTRLAMLKPGLDTTSGCSVLRQRGPKGKPRRNYGSSRQAVRVRRNRVVSILLPPEIYACTTRKLKSFAPAFSFNARWGEPGLPDYCASCASAISGVSPDAR